MSEKTTCVVCGEPHGDTNDPYTQANTCKACGDSFLAQCPNCSKGLVTLKVTVDVEATDREFIFYLDEYPEGEASVADYEDISSEESRVPETMIRATCPWCDQDVTDYVRYHTGAYDYIKQVTGTDL